MNKRTYYLLVLCFCLISLLIPILVTPVSAEEQVSSVGNDQTTIQTGIYVISISNFDFTKGTYVIDFYLMFKWNNQNISPAGFEFLNGRPNAKEKIYELITNESSEVWYRIQASLFITPEFKNYPFDAQDVNIIIEDSKYNISSLTYAPMTDITGTNKNFTLAGWEITSYNTTIKNNEYPWGETYSQLVFTITLARNTGLSAIKILIPPIIFCIVSGLSFFFKADKITHRLGLGTSMLISAVMFHLSQTSSLPPLPSLILIDKIMIAAYSFLAASLFATTLMYIDDEYWKDVDYTHIVNRFGGILTVILPFIVFAILYFF